MISIRKFSREKGFSFIAVSPRLLVNIRDAIEENKRREIFLSCDIYKNRTADMCKVGKHRKWVFDIARVLPDKIARFVDTHSLTQSVLVEESDEILRIPTAYSRGQFIGET